LATSEQWSGLDILREEINIARFTMFTYLKLIYHALTVLTSARSTRYAVDGFPIP